MQPGAKFLGIPGVFLYFYKEELGRWMRDFRRIGPRFDLWLKTGGLPIKGDGSSPPMVPSIERVTLVGTLVQERYLIIRPKDGQTEKRISKHSEDLEDQLDSPREGKWRLQ